MLGGSALDIPIAEGLFWMLCSRYVSVTLIVTLIRLVRTPLLCTNKNNGDKFYRRKSMWAANEKVIINEL